MLILFFRVEKVNCQRIIFVINIDIPAPMQFSLRFLTIYLLRASQQFVDKQIKHLSTFSPNKSSFHQEQIQTVLRLFLVVILADYKSSNGKDNLKRKALFPTAKLSVSLHGSCVTGLPTGVVIEVLRGSRGGRKIVE